jgi:hypothetical protein
MGRPVEKELLMFNPGAAVALLLFPGLCVPAVFGLGVIGIGRQGTLADRPPLISSFNKSREASARLLAQFSNSSLAVFPPVRFPLILARLEDVII